MALRAGVRRRNQRQSDDWHKTPCPAHVDPRLYQQFVDLVKIIDDENVLLGVIPERTNGLLGDYHPNPNGQGPRIWLVRCGGGERYGLEGVLAVKNCRFELITLVHEYGHHRSHVDGTRPAIIDEVVKAWQANGAIPWEHAILNIEQEHRAWDLARRTLTRLGFTEWAAFNMRQAEGIGAHCAYLRAGKRIGELLDGS